MKYKLFVSDFDGTLGKSAGDCIDEETVAAIKKYKEAGGVFAVCTGRMLTSIRPILLRYGLSGLIVSFQGARINDIETGKSLLDGGIDYRLAAEVTLKLLEERVPTVADIGEVMYCEQLSPYTDFHKTFSEIKVVDSLVDTILLKKQAVHKIVSAGEPSRIGALTKKYSDLYKGRLICNNGSDLLLEVINPEYSKGNAVRFLAEYYNVPADKIIAVGDSTNDIELLSGEWHGVAVGDAKEELKKIADEITVPFKDRPVKTLLEKYCL